MTKEQFIDHLLKTLTPMVEKFAAQPSPAAAQSQEHRAKLERQKTDAAKVFDEGSAAYNAAVAALDEELKGLKVDDRTQRKQNLQLVAEALVNVGNTLRVPIKLRDTGRPASSGKSPSAGSAGGKRTRKTNAQMEEEAQLVLKALPGAKKDYAPKSEIADQVGFDPQSALLKLKRDGEAESNGLRGAGGGWRRTS